MDRVLHLVSPVMKGLDVKEAQALLTDNPYGNFKPGELDGVYGETTAGAVRRAKLWLGYPKKSLDARYGRELNGYLTGAVKLPMSYRTRRRSRLKKAQETPLRVRAYNEGVKKLGEKENPPFSNKVRFSRWYGIIGAWCAMFVTFCYVLAGSKRSFIKSMFYAYCPYIYRDARYGRNGMALLHKSMVMQGHVILYDWDNDGVADHVGMFERWMDAKETRFTAIEGNTSGSSDSDGGEVMRRERSINDVIAFVQAEV